jgi:O-antigen/teichoic acid export membrane protein
LSVIKEFSRDTLIYGLGSSLKKFIGLFLLPFYARALTPKDFGILETLGTGIFFLTAFFNLGLDQGAGRYFFKAKSAEEKGQILFNLLVFRFILVIPSLGLMFFSRKISVGLFKTDQYSAVVLLSCLLFPLTVLNSDQDNIYRYFREPWKFNLITIVRILSGIGLGISLVIIMKRGVFGAQLASLLSSLVIFLLSFFLFTRKKYTYRFSWYWAGRMLKYSFPLVWAGIASWIFYSSNRFFILHFRDATDVGLYSIGNMLSQPLALLNGAIKMSYGPMILGIYEEETSPDKPKTKSYSTLIWYFYLLIGVSMGIFLSVFSVDLLKLITTPAYVLGALAMPFVIFSSLATQSVEIVSVGMSFKEKSGTFAVLFTISAFINIAMNFLFVPRYGFVGAAVATLISSFAYFLLTYIVSQKLFFVRRKEMSLAFYVLAALAISAVFPFAELRWHVSPGLGLKAAVVVLSCGLPFLAGFVKVNDVKKFCKELTSKR